MEMKRGGNREGSDNSRAGAKKMNRTQQRADRRQSQGRRASTSHKSVKCGEEKTVDAIG